MLETITPFLYRISLLIYNKSHVPAIVEYSRRSDSPLESTAHEVLKEISSVKPQIFKAHVKELCGLLEEQAPTTTKANDPGTVDTLKACAGFAAKFPKDMPTERKFLQALVSFALYGSPPEAAKHAVTILMASAERKEMYATDLIKKCITGFKFGADHFLARLATICQLMFLAPREADEENDRIIDIATKEILLKVRTSKTASQKQWLDDDEIDDECKAKVWALKILVNRLRSSQDAKESKELAEPVIRLLNTLITKEGELSKKQDTPPAHKSRLRLVAAQLLLKLCRTKVYDELLAPDAFNRLACVAQDSIYQVRLKFVTKLKKYLGHALLPVRFYTIVFLMAYEPQEEFRDETVTWIKARAKSFAQQKGTVMESVFSRLLNLLAHHPDFSPNADDLADFSKYILFYLRPVATEENLSLIFYVAQRVKQARDAISPDKSDNLYCLSDLAQAIIQRYEDVNGWSMQAWPGKLKLPVQLFAPLASHAIAQEIANKSYLPKELEERLDGLVKARPKTKRVGNPPFKTTYNVPLPQR
jgi:sister chromatid cohesion protein PDS5